MSQLNEHYLVITVLGTNRPGIINSIIRHIDDCQCDIEDSNLTILGDEFTFTLLLSGQWQAITLLESTLPHKGATLNLLIVTKRTYPRKNPRLATMAWVQIKVNNTPDIIDCFINLFSNHHMAIAKLISHTYKSKGKQSAQLYIQITVQSEKVLDVSNIEQAFQHLCKELNAQGSISIVNYPQYNEIKMENSDEPIESR